MWQTSVNSCGPGHPEWETGVGNKWEASVGAKRGRQVEDKCKLIHNPKHPEPKQPEWETSVRDKWDTSLNS